MANTNSPQFNTYKTVEVKFDALPMYRTGDLSVQRDAQIINMYYDRLSQENKQREVRLKKRPGLKNTDWSLSKNASTNNIRGSFYDVDQNALYWAVNDKVYNYKPDTATSRTVCTLTTSSGYVGFCSFLNQALTKKYVCISDGTDLWVDDWDAGTCTDVTDVDMPSPHVPTPLYIDGYLLLAKADSNEIYNSDVDDPTSWTTSNIISAERNSDNILRLFNWKNYVIAAGANSIEYFWDAGNATGSPFSRNDSPIRNVGYVTAGANAGDSVYFVGQDEKFNLGVYTIADFKATKISNSVVDRTLQDSSSDAGENGTARLDVDGHVISIDGHSFYVVVTTQTTWVYDIDEKLWYEWKGTDGNGLPIQAAWAMYNGTSYVALDDRDTISFFSQTVYRDHGVNFTCQYTTEDTNFDTFNWKICNRVALLCSMHNYTGTSNATISWSDNDWADGGTTPERNINVFSSSPYITRCGKFRNRSFRIKYADNYPFFMSGLQLDINVLGI